MKKFLIFLFLLGWCHMAYAETNNGMIARIAEIEIEPGYFDQYIEFAGNIAKESVEKEPGVLAIYPMSQSRDKNQIRILEIYKNKDAYQKHLGAEHFKIYKTGTAHMVKSLDLVDMNQIAPVVFEKIFESLDI